MKKFSLLFMLLILVVTSIFINNNIYAVEPAPLEQMKGIWVHGSVLRQLGANSVVNLVNDLKNYGFTDIFLIVKGNSGQTGYPSKVALASVSDGRDLLKETITEAHKNNIRVHAWYMVHNDAAWVKKYPEDAMCNVKGASKADAVSMLSPNYRKYFVSMVKEVIENYEVDGIHLDGIRYTHIVYSFDKYVLKEAKKRRIDIEKVKSLINKDASRGSAIIKAYNSGDPDVVAWEKLRRDVVVGIAREVKKVVKKANRPLYYSAALMPEGAYTPDFADVFYAQNYKDAASLYDIIIPMAYWKGFGSPPQWVGSTVTKGAIANVGKVPIMAGLQAFEVPGNKQIDQATDSAIANGAKGVVYFRYNTFAFATVQTKNSADGKSLISFEILNRSESSAIDTIEVYFNGTGLIPKAIVEAPADTILQVTGSIISLTGNQMLAIGKTITILVEVEKDQTVTVSSPMPTIILSAQKKIFTPVCAIMK